MVFQILNTIKKQVGMMAILGIFTGENITREMNETLRKEVDWEHKHPKGLVFEAHGQPY